MKAPTQKKESGEQPGLLKNTRTTNSSNFTGTSNPRHLRVIIQLMFGRDVRREQIDEIAGTSNGPELIAELRRRGLHIPSDRIDAIDRDGRPCRPGVFWLTADDFRKLSEWITTNPQFGVTDGKCT